MNNNVRMKKDKIMKKLLISTIFVAVSAILTSAPVLADGLVFDPSSYPSKSVSTGENYQTTSVYSTSPVNTKKVNDVTNEKTRTTNSMQNALFELDSAQVDIRNQLLDAKAKYTDIDNQYKMIKEQRKLQNKTVREAEKRIKQIEKTKNQIRKSMQIQ